MKLDTTQAVLEWALGYGYSMECGPEDPADTQTAAYLAYCVRVTEAAQKQAMYETARWGDDRWAEMLRNAEASAEQGHK